MQSMEAALDAEFGKDSDQESKCLVTDVTTVRIVHTCSVKFKANSSTLASRFNQFQ